MELYAKLSATKAMRNFVENPTSRTSSGWCCYREGLDLATAPWEPSGQEPWFVWGWPRNEGSEVNQWSPIPDAVVEAAIVELIEMNGIVIVPFVRGFFKAPEWSRFKGEDVEVFKARMKILASALGKMMDREVFVEFHGHVEIQIYPPVRERVWKELPGDEVEDRSTLVLVNPELSLWI